MTDLGYNYRITDFQCALGISQLKKLPGFLSRRQEIARLYNKAFTSISQITPLSVNKNVFHAFHLYVIKIDFNTIGISRAELFNKLRDRGIAVNVHYIPVHLHPFYRKAFQTGPGLCPVAENAYEQIISLPIFPDMTDTDVETVVNVINDSI